VRCWQSRNRVSMLYVQQMFVFTASRPILQNADSCFMGSRNNANSEVWGGVVNIRVSCSEILGWDLVPETGCPFRSSSVPPRLTERSLYITFQNVSHTTIAMSTCRRVVFTEMIAQIRQHVLHSTLSHSLWLTHRSTVYEAFWAAAHSS
jgi:hypothetical protein